MALASSAEAGSKVSALLVTTVIALACVASLREKRETG
jgi:hypothetical protein